MLFVVPSVAGTVIGDARPAEVVAGATVVVVAVLLPGLSVFMTADFTR